jgi:tetratricopeptide (TPR) repeat protein
MLGQCLLDMERYNEAATVWLSVPKKNANDHVNIGIAFLNTEEWDEAIAHLEKALQLQEDPRTCYLLALAHARGRYWLGRDIETIQRCIALLQQAKALPACPPEVYLQLDKTL